jgi:hypothetical protein
MAPGEAQTHNIIRPDKEKKIKKRIIKDNNKIK